MGSEASCCRGPSVTIQSLGPEPQSRQDGDQYVCTEWSHVESLLAHLPSNVHAMLENEAFQSKCRATFKDIVKSRKADDSKDPGFLEGEELIEAVHRSMPDSFLQGRLHVSDLSKLMLAFDIDSDGRISQSEFDLFCMWTVAMDVMGFFTGTTPFAKIANEAAAVNLVIISEFLDPDHVLGRCALPTTACAYYHPDGITLDEFCSQLASAAYLRTKQGKFFNSVALANHGPDEHGFWNVCSDQPVNLRSVDHAWPRLMPVFQALADMVSGPSHLGNVDLLACNFAANQTGLNCLEMIEQNVNAKFSASTDATGNVASQGNWELERGGRNVAPIYFHEEKLEEFTNLMAPGKSRTSCHYTHQLPVEIEGKVIKNLKDGNDVCPAHDGMTMSFQEKAVGALKARDEYHDPYAAAKSHPMHAHQEEVKFNKHEIDSAKIDTAPKRRHDGTKAKPKSKQKAPVRHPQAAAAAADEFV